MTDKDIGALRHKLKTSEDELKRIISRNARLEKRQEMMDLTDVEDGDLKNMKQLFIDTELEMDEREKKLNEREGTVNQLESDHKEREKSDLVKSLAETHKVKVEDIQDTEDPEKKALQLVVERMTSGEKKEESKEETLTPEDVFEHNSAGGKLTKMPRDMVDANGKVDSEALATFAKEHALPSK